MEKKYGWPERVVVWLVTLVFVTAGAIGLHFRRSVVGLAAPAMLAITMVVGAGFHLTYDTPPEAVPATVLAFLALFVLVMRRPRNTVAPA